jgi:hypothetical protein
VAAELREHGLDSFLVANGARQGGPRAELAHAVGDRVKRPAFAVAPLCAEHVVDELARIGRKEGRIVRALGQPRRRQVGEERLALCDPHESRDAGERHPPRREQALRFVGQSQEVEPLRDQAIALADELRHFRVAPVLVHEAAVRARLLDRAQVGTDHVLGHGECQRLAVRLAHLGGHLAELGGLRRPVSAFARDDREAAVGVRRERQRGDDPVPLDRGS